MYTIVHIYVVIAYLKHMKGEKPTREEAFAHNLTTIFYMIASKVQENVVLRERRKRR